MAELTYDAELDTRLNKEINTELGGDDYPGEDEPVSPEDNLSVIQAVMAFKRESEDARKERDQHNEINYDVAHCRQDNSDKVEGQSHEFLPKTPMALEQLGAFIKNGLVAFGNWFQTELSPDPGLTTPPGQPVTKLTASGITKLIKHRLESAEQIAPGGLDFATTISDAIKTGALASLMVLKVHGQKVPTRRPDVDLKTIEEAYADPTTGSPMMRVRTEEELVLREGTVWRLVVELVRPEDYFPDPTGRGLYEIHRTRKDLYQVLEMAESGDYDPEAVALLAESYNSAEVDADIEGETDQSSSTPPHFRPQVEILECWSTLLDSEGRVAIRMNEEGKEVPQRNIRCAVANEQFLIRKPEPNPFWHQESPFVSAALLRVPFSVFHKALFDDAVRLNLAQNGIFNLMLDGGIKSVWGITQVHAHLVQNFDQFADGIPPGAVVIASELAEPGKPVVMQVDSGTVPRESMDMFRVLGTEFEAATKLNSIQLGSLPKKDVRATEVAASEQSNSIFFDSMIADVERGLIVKALRLAWLTMLQNCDDWLAEDVVGCIGPEAASDLARMSPARRYMTYAQGCRFKVNGLSSILARTREFQKFLAVTGVVGQNPMLLQAFMQTSSPVKLLHFLYKSVNIDPEDLKNSEEEHAALQETLTQMQFFQGLTQGGGGGAGGAGQVQNMPQQQPGAPQQAMQAGTDRLQSPQQEL